MNSAGSLYGTTQLGGTANAGTMFELKPSGKTWTFGEPHQFAMGVDGANPTGLSMDRTGSIYGTTNNGTGFAGAVYWLRPPASGQRTPSPSCGAFPFT